MSTGRFAPATRRGGDSFVRRCLGLSVAAEVQFLLTVVLLKILVEKARLNVFVLLVLARMILRDRAFDGVVEDLANLHPGINADRLNSNDLECPVTAESNITESCGDVNEHPESTDRRASFEHRNEVSGLCVLHGSAEIHLIRLKNEPSGGICMRR